MKKIFVLLLLVSLSGIAQQNSKNFIDQNYIEVTGTVESEIVPDEIYISITINEKDKKGKVSVEQLESKMVQQLKSIGIDTEKNLTVDSFSSHYIDFFLKKDDALKKKQYTLLVNNTTELTKAFRVFDVLEISNAFINRVDHSKIDELKLEAKIRAIKMAKNKAITYAEAINQSVGKALLIKENNQLVNTNFYPRNYNLQNEVVIRGNGFKKNTNSNLDFKKITITASVEAKFELL